MPQMLVVEELPDLLDNVDPDELDWEALGRRKSEFLRRHPGLWFMVGAKSYPGGFSHYTSSGFAHAVRRNDDGGWDHYLQWPGDDGGC